MALFSLNEDNSLNEYNFLEWIYTFVSKYMFFEWIYFLES